MLMGKLLIGFLVLAIGATALVFLAANEGSVAPYAQNGAQLTNMYLGNLPLKVEIARTDAERRLGLGGRISLEQDQGMLFVFDRPQRLEFWMKDMHFPLDMIWLDQNFMIVDISKDVRPDTYPQTFSPKIPAQYVLEVNAGVSDSFGIGEGTKLTFVRNFLTN